jgi:two-component system OmpR family sensor kinase
MSASASRSLESRLLSGLVAVILVTGLFTGTLSFLWALADANEVADGALKETTSLLLSGQVALPAVSSVLPGTEPENDVLVWRLSIAGDMQRGVPSIEPVSAGLRTISWRGDRWRVLATPFARGDWLLVAQRMEVRDEMARHSAVRTVLPLLVLVPMLALLVRVVVRGALAPVRRLGRHIDEHPLDRAAQLPELDVPAELHPFVMSIRGLVGELSLALERQRRFVANAAHELRSPVAALSIQAANLENVLVDPRARERMQPLSQGIARLQALLEQLLSMARAQLHRANADRRVGLAELAREMLAEFVPQAADRGIDLGVDQLSEDAWVVADRFDLQLLLGNVIGNAVKFCPPGSEVTLSVSADGGQAVLRVIDNGPGMDDASLAFAFEPFFRGAEVREPGSGLGLSIVAAIAERLDAEISLQPSPHGSGLVFEYRQAMAS